MKDRKQTEENIIHAVDTIIREKGFGGLGINAIAKQAGISKVLIYRYFGSYDELIETWALKNSYWTGRMANTQGQENTIETGISILTGQVDTLRKNSVLREIERWLLMERTAPGDKVMAELEKQGTEITKTILKNISLKKSSNGIDAEALIAILTAGINYLALKSDRCDIYNGISLRSDNGWERIKKTVTDLGYIVFKE